MRVNDLLRQGTESLDIAGVEESELDARLLLEFVLGKNRTELFLAARDIPTENEISHYHQLIGRRSKREPVAYIIGEQEFWSFTFTVTPDVLIPRPETEFLLEQVLLKTKKENYLRGKIADLCCGSGVIATVLAHETGQKVYGIDVSYKALQVSLVNLARHHLMDKVHLVQGDLLSAFSTHSDFSLIVSNPPYVSHLDVNGNLEPEVAEFEPHLALDGGKRGMELIYIIRQQLENVLLPGGQFFMEFGADQAGEIQTLFETNVEVFSGFSKVEILKDYAGRDRVLHAIKTEI
ncbi:peptide chain release factor N(5)-glutamine methyltransferase [Desulforhopalus sp. 52FAK]